MFSFLYHCQDFYRTWFYMSSTVGVLSEAGTANPWRAPPGSVFLYFQLFVGVFMSYVRYVYWFVYNGVQHILCCVFGLFVLVYCNLLYPVSLDCPFWVAPSIISKVYVVTNLCCCANLLDVYFNLYLYSNTHTHTHVYVCENKH